MKIAFFLCVSILLCTVAITSRASETAHTSKHHASAIERDSESAIAEIDSNINNFELATKQLITDAEKNQRGKGSNGGGSIARQPRIKSSAVTLKRLSISTSTTDFISSVLMLLVLPFVIS